MSRKQTPLFAIHETESSRPSRLGLIIAMLVLLAVVVVASFKLVSPEGTSFSFSNRHARHQLVEAERLERNSLYRSASETYSAVMDNSKLNNDLRRQAAMRLAVIYTENLPEPAKAEVALEKAYMLYPDGTERDAVRQRLEALRGRPVTQTELATFPADDQTSDASESPLVARIGKRAVRLDELIFAWHEFRGSAQPEGQAFRDFVNNYLDLVLLAQKAHDLNLDKQGRTELDLRLKELTVLNAALTQYMIKNLPTPDEETLDKFYQANVVTFSQPASADIGHIVATDEASAKKIAAAFDDGDQSFEEIARRYSADADKLPDGCRLGQISADQVNLPGLGKVSGLAAKLVAMKDGDTAGPIATDRGVHWIKVYAIHQAAPMPFDAIHDQVMFAYQKSQLMRQRTQLIATLKKQYPIEVYKTDNVADVSAAPAVTPVASQVTLDENSTTTETHTSDAATTSAAREE